MSNNEREDNRMKKNRYIAPGIQVYRCGIMEEILIGVSDGGTEEQLGKRHGIMHDFDDDAPSGSTTSSVWDE